MIDKLSAQQRLLLAVALSFVFFMAYEYFIIKKYPPKEQNATKEVATKVAQKTNIPKTGSSTPTLPNATTQALPSKADTTNYIAIIKAKHYEAKIDELGRISKYYLNDKKFKNEKGERTQVVNEKSLLKPLEISFADSNLNSEAVKTPYTTSKSEISLNGNKQSIVLTQKLSSTTVTKTLTFFPDGNYEVQINLSEFKDYFISPGVRPNILADGYTFHGIIVEKSDNSLEVVDDGDIEKNEFNNAPILAAADRYYVTSFYNFNNGLHVFLTSGDNQLDNPFVKGLKDMNFGAYIGPKDHKTLKQINPRLLNIIEYGWFTFIAKPVFTLLSYLHGIIGNWGWAIVAMTFLIRLVLFPLTYKGMVSMNKLKELSPKIKELQAKYKGEPQKLNTHMMDLYKKHGANPMGGCLPILLQIPVFFAIYRVLLNAIELKAAPWIFWINDLSIKDPYFILPILMGITMYLHQRLTPTNFTDPMQEKIMKFLPLIFTFFFVTFPAGLTLYWFVNNVFSIIQQMYVNKIFEKKKEEREAIK